MTTHGHIRAKRRGRNTSEAHTRSEMSSKVKEKIEPPTRSSALSRAASRSAVRRRGSSTHTTQAMPRMTILYQLQNRHSALESRSLVPSSTKNAQTTPTMVRAR